MVAGSFVLVYIIAMIAIGIWGMRRTATVGDFFLGGRKVGPLVSALAFGTSYFSAVLFIGFAGKLGWAFGLNVLWIAIGNAVFGSMLAWIVLGHRTRIMTQNLDAMTMPEFFEARYESQAIKIFSAIVVFVFLLPYSASVYKGLGHLFEITFDIPYTAALLLMTILTGIYLILGGYFAVTLTDFIQGIIMLVGSVLMVWLLTRHEACGGLGKALSTIRENYPAHVPPGKQPGMLLLVSLVFMTSFGTWGLPQMVQKFYAIKNEKVIRTATVATTLFALVVVTAAYFNGALTHVFFNPENLPMANGKPAFDQLIPTLLSSYLPESMMGLILLLVLSASMSTLASLVLVSSSAIAMDIYQKYQKSEADQRTTLVLMRVLSAVFVAISLVMAIYPFDIILVLMSLSWGAVAGTFLSTYLYGLYWKGATRIGAWASMIVGLGTAVGLFFVLGPAKSPIASTIAMIVPLGVMPVVSLMTPKPKQETLDRAFEDL